MSRSPMGEGIKRHFIETAIYSTLMGFVMNMPIDNAAHFGGLAGGFAVAYLAGTPRLVDDWREKLWYGAAALCLILTAMAFLRMAMGLG